MSEQLLLSRYIEKGGGGEAMNEHSCGCKRIQDVGICVVN